MTTANSIPEPTDLPPGSKAAWRALVAAVNELRGVQSSNSSRLVAVDRAAQAAQADLGAVRTDLAQQGVELGMIKDTYVPIEPIRKPSTPTLTTGSGQVTINWDGNLLDIPEIGGGEGTNPTYGTPVPLKASDNTGFAYVYAEWSDTGLPDPPSPDDTTPQVSTWFPVGGTLTEAGSFVQTVVNGTTRYYRLVAVNRANIKSGPSEVANITSVGVYLTDLEQEVQDKLDEIEAAANTAQTTADGKVTTSPNAPTNADGANKPVGALWWQKSGGSVIGLWEWTGTAPWQARTFGETTVGQINIGTGTYGNLSGIRLDANTVTAKQIAITDYSNYLKGGEFDTPNDMGNWIGDWASRGIVSTAETYNSRGSYRVAALPSGTTFTLSQYINVVPGQKYRFDWSQLTSGDYNGTSTNGKLRIGNTTSSPDSGFGTVITSFTWGLATSWTQRTEYFEVPAGVKQINVALSYDQSVGVIILDNMRMRLMGVGELIVDGDIDGRTITGATIRTSPTGQRLQLDTFGLRSFDASNTVTSTLYAQSGGLSLSGSLWLGPSTTNGAYLDRTTLSLAGGNGAWSMVSHGFNSNGSSDLKFVTAANGSNKGQAAITLYSAVNSDSLPTYVSVQGEFRPSTINQQGNFAQNRLNKLTVDTADTSDDIFSGSDLTTSNYGFAVGPGGANRIIMSGRNRKIQGVSGNSAASLTLNPAGGSVIVGDNLLNGSRGRLYTSAAISQRGGSPQAFVRIARIDGGAAAGGAYLQGMFYGGGNYGTVDKYSALVHFGQRGDNGAKLEVWEYGMSSANSNAPTWKVVQASTYIFELWVGLPGFSETFDFIPTSMQQASVYSDFIAQGSDPGGNASLVSIHPEPGTVYSSQTHTNAQSIPTNLWTPVWMGNTTAIGRSGIGLSQQQIQIVQAGIYSVTASVAYATLGSVSGRRIIRLGDSNSSTANVIQQFEQPPWTGSRNIINMSMTRYFPANQFLSLQTYQNQGTALDLGTDPGENYLHVARVG